MRTNKKQKSIIALTALFASVAMTDALATASNSHSDSGPSTTTKQVRFRPLTVREESKPAPRKQETKKETQAPRTMSTSFIPKNAKAGECYAQVLVPAEYRDVTEKVLVKEASSRVEIVPAQYETVKQRVMVKGPSKKLEIVPAEFKTVKEKVLVSEESSRIIEVPAEYGWREERVLVTPARTVWKKGENPIGGLENATGEVVCLVEEPAVYKTVKKQIVTKPATTRVEVIPAVYDYVEKVVEAKPSFTRVIEIPAEYETISVKKLVKPETKRLVEIPAEYGEITRTVKVKASSSEWGRILCETNATPEMIHDIQKALQAKGFNPGEPDGVFNSKTQMALQNYQVQMNLPQGALDYKTLRTLGLNL